MFLRISQFMNCAAERGHGLCTRVHGVGTLPSTMDRFMLPNMHEVLFVN